ncbi:hypothetical protein C8J56DRAFT_1112358 [Mycena floridula]|nr:hypothetical protein C8J56DRAFT_1112358 [Mycena floridula]
MFGIKYLCFLTAFFPAVLSTTLPPTFTKLYNGALLVDTSAGPVAGPFGTRVLFRIGGGNLTDPTTGDVVANFIPGLGGETGLIASNNVFYPSAQVGLQWVDDNKYAWAELHGIGESVAGQLAAGTGHIRLETDSPARTKLNGLFTIYTINITTVPATLAIYGLDA